MKLAQHLLNMQDYLGGLWAVKQAWKITTRHSEDIDCWTTWPYDVAGTCAYYAGFQKESRDYYLDSWRICPHDKRMTLNVKFVRRYLQEYQIVLLWPTIRPTAFKKRYADWLDKAHNKYRIKVRIAVNTDQQRAELADFNDVQVIGDSRPGVAYASYKLAKEVQGLPGDIIVLASDDFYPPDGWDAWIYNHMDDFHGALLVNDTVNREGVVTLPIMDYACLLLLGRIIYHPSYHHLYSDNELYDNLVTLQLLKNLQQKDQPTFEHRHWYHGKREKDKVDDVINDFMDSDMHNYNTRRAMPLQAKLCSNIE
jgi:hypothetical protein